MNEKALAETIAIYNEHNAVMREFAKDAAFKVIVARNITDFQIFSLEELLPNSFGPENLSAKELEGGTE